MEKLPRSALRVAVPVTGVHIIVVTGATGTIGRTVARVLSQAGEDVLSVSRDPAVISPWGRTVHADPSDPKTLESSLDGATAILISPRAVGRSVRELLRLVSANGGRRVVLLSSLTVVHPAGNPEFAAQFRDAEDAVAASGMDWTTLRCADFAANALAWAPQIRELGKVRGANGKAASATVHEVDVAEVAAAALTGDERTRGAHVLTGPQSLSQRDKVQLIGEATGTSIPFEEIPAEEFRRAMRTPGLPREITERLLGSLADYAARAGPVTDTVELLLGRPALPFAQWARERGPAFSRHEHHAHASTVRPEQRQDPSSPTEREVTP